MPQLYIGLGSNVGDARMQLTHACMLLVARGIFSEQTFIQSRVYASKAMLPEGAPLHWDMPFCNQVVGGETHMQPERLLESVKQIETKMGRQDRGRWGPREIDIDIIDYNSLAIQSDTLVSPHPHMQERDFVLIPLHDIAPDWQHPVSKKNVQQLINALGDVECRPL